MCAIAGLFSIHQELPEATAHDGNLRRMTGLIARRGPNDGGWYGYASGVGFDDA